MCSFLGILPALGLALRNHVLVLLRRRAEQLLKRVLADAHRLRMRPRIVV